MELSFGCPVAAIVEPGTVAADLREPPPSTHKRCAEARPHTCMSAKQYGSGSSLPGRAALERLDVTNHASALTKNAAGMLESDELDNDKMVPGGRAGPTRVEPIKTRFRRSPNAAWTNRRSLFISFFVCFGLYHST